MSVPKCGQDVGEIRDGIWRRLGCVGIEDRRRGAVSNSISFEVEDGRVVGSGGYLMLRDAGNSGTAIEVERPAAITYALSLGPCEAWPCGELPDGLYVHDETSYCAMAFGGYVVMDGLRGEPR